MSDSNVETGSTADPVHRASLADMRAGQTGIVVEIDGGHGLSRKLDCLGIRKGSRITKVSALWMRGPVVLRQGNTQAAVGLGMARRIFVQLTAEKEGG